jgi:hypothetical protein
MNNKYLLKALCLLVVLVAPQANAAYLLNPTGSDYWVDEACFSCSGVTDINVHIQANVPIVLEFDSMGSWTEEIRINLTNDTNTSWNNLTIEYNNHDPSEQVNLGLNVLGSGTSTPTIDAILTNPNTGLPTGLALSFLPPESDWVGVEGFADRNMMFDPFQPYSITISTSAVPVPAAVWLFGSGLIGLIGIARRKARV